MNSNFQNIDEYIQQQDAEFQKKLLELRQIILQAAPKETEETISYKMPTFRYNGNLIHFAQFKNHIGLYPGPKAIEEFKDELIAYKTTKGAIQIPNNQNLDKALIHKIVQLNAAELANKKDTRWTQYREQWLDLYEKMSDLLAKTPLEKELKWGMDIYTYKGKNVVGWAGFKKFFSVWFYNGVFLNDPYKVLIAASEGKTKALRQWRFAESSAFDEVKILEYIHESMQTIDDGKYVPAQKAIAVKPEGILKDELVKVAEFNKAFEKLTPGRQKEYIIYINEAKQEKTKISRLEKIKPIILSGRGLNDKYKR